MSAKRKKKMLAAAGAVLLAGLTAIASGLGQKAVDALTSGAQVPISYSVEEQAYECGLSTYFPETNVDRVVSLGTPTDWEAFQRQTSAAFSGANVVQVAIQGDSARTVTLTGIRFRVVPRERRPGATFSAPCGGGINARGLVVDVEETPPRILSSSRELEGSVESGGLPGSTTKPISFPWTVSLTDSLLLYLVAKAESCDCSWSAEIPWVSGDQRGTIEIDDGGEPFRVVGEEGIPAYTIGEDGWSLFRTASGELVH